MADMRDAYVQWILNGRQGPRPGNPGAGLDHLMESRRIPPGQEVGPVPPGRQMVPQGPRSLVPQGGEASDLPIWAGMESAIPAAGAAAAFLHSPSLNAGEDKALEDMGRGPIQSEVVKPGVADSVGTPVKAGGNDFEDLMKIQPKTLTRPAGTVSPSDKMKASVAKVKVSDAADQDRSQVKSLDDLRVLARELQRQQMKQEMGQ